MFVPNKEFEYTSQKIRFKIKGNFPKNLENP